MLLPHAPNSCHLTAIQLITASRVIFSAYSLAFLQHFSVNNADKGESKASLVNLIIYCTVTFRKNLNFFSLHAFHTVNNKVSGKQIN